MTAMLDDRPSPEGIIVKSVRLSDLMRKHDRIDILKLDIEGTELEVLRSIATDLPQVDQVLVEVHIYEHDEDPLPEILSILTGGSHRYEIGHWSTDAHMTTCLVRSWRISDSVGTGSLVFL